jgi:hypothetical protein
MAGSVLHASIASMPPTMRYIRQPHPSIDETAAVFLANRLNTVNFPYPIQQHRFSVSLFFLRLASEFF